MNKFKKKKNLILNKCEIEECQEKINLHLHHIIERTEENTTNDSFNLAILCPNHHSAVHSGDLQIIGIYPATRLPNKRILIYKLNGISNVPGIEEPYIKYTNKTFKV